MELRQLRTFQVVAETLNITRAAEVLNYAQSSVTAQIQALEKELDTLLFERLGKRIVLTPAGLQLTGYAEKMLRLEEEALSVISGSGEPAGRITVGASESVLTYRLAPVLVQFREKWPRVDLIFRPDTESALYHGLSTGRLDVAVMMDSETHPPDLIAERLRTEPLLILARPSHPLAHREQVRSADLSGEAVLLTETGCTYRTQFEQILAESGTARGGSVEFSSVEAIKQGVIAGMGIAILPAMAVRAEVDQGRLAPLKWAGSPLSINTSLVWHKDKWLSPALRAFMETTRATLRAQVPAGS